MDQEFGHSAAYFGQAVVDHSTGMPTQRSIRVKKRCFIIAGSSASQPNFQPAGRTMTVIVDRNFPVIRAILET